MHNPNVTAHNNQMQEGPSLSFRSSPKNSYSSNPKT